MDFVCKDLDGKSEWHYDAEGAVYQRFDASGNPDNASGVRHTARIYGKFLPNPAELFINRCAQSGLHPGSGEAQKAKPTAVTFALWNHWQGVQNANHKH